MNFLERLLLNQQANSDKKNNYGITPMQTPEQFAQNQQLDQQRQKLAENLQQTGSPIRAAQNFLIHPKNALFGIQSNNQEQPISYQQPLVGVDVTQQDYDNMSKQGLLPETPLISAGVKENPRTGGLLNDLTSGFRENSQNGFDVSNLENNTTDYGAKKGLGYKAGELLGTAARFGNSPMGRFALTAGLVGATGGSPLQMVGYGASAGVRNQQLQTQDKMYRKALEDNGIDTSNISGYIDGDMYRNYSLGNYRYGMLNLGNKKIDQTSYIALKKQYDSFLKDGSFTPEEYILRMNELNKKMDNGTTTTVNAGNVGQSNQTYNARVNVPERLKIQKQNANTYQKGVTGNLGLKSGMQPLNKKKTQLQIEQIQKVNQLLDGEKTPQINPDPLGIFN